MFWTFPLEVPVPGEQESQNSGQETAKLMEPPRLQTWNCWLAGLEPTWVTAFMESALSIKERLEFSTTLNLTATVLAGTSGSGTKEASVSTMESAAV